MEEQGGGRAFSPIKGSMFNTVEGLWKYRLRHGLKLICPTDEMAGYLPGLAPSEYLQEFAGKGNYQGFPHNWVSQQFDDITDRAKWSC